MRDPYPESEEEPGPLLSLLLDAERNKHGFDEAWLLCTGGTFLERARDLEREARDENLLTRFYPMDFPLGDVVDYSEIWAQLGRGLNNALRSAANTSTTKALGPEAFPDDVRQSIAPGSHALRPRPPPPLSRRKAST